MIGCYSRSNELPRSPAKHRGPPSADADGSAQENVCCFVAPALTATQRGPGSGAVSGGSNGPHRRGPEQETGI
ncbi:hypothetical protein GCM10009687_13310 [Asanoa iriomotensis]